METLLEEKNYSVVCLSETHIREHQKDCVNLNGYKFAAAYNRKVHERGGVAILVRDDDELEFIERTDICELSVEFSVECCAIEIPKYDILLINVYRSDRNMETFFEFLEKLLVKIKSFCLNKNVLIGGDFNIKNSKRSCHYNRLCNTLLEFNLHQTIHKPTRITKSTSNCIDLFFTNQKPDSFHVTVEEHGMSDHCAPCYTLIHNHNKNDKQKKSKSIFTYKRIFNHKNLEYFKTQLQKIDWNTCLSTENSVNENYNLFEKTLITLLDKCIPKVRIKLQFKKKLSWLTKGLRTSCKNKRLLRCLITRTNDKTLKKHYKLFTKILKTSIKKSKIISYTKVMSKSTNKTKSMWSIINETTNKKPNIRPKENIIIRTDDRKILSCPISIANSFNDHFVSIGDGDRCAISRGARGGGGGRGGSGSSIAAPCTSTATGTDPRPPPPPQPPPPPLPRPVSNSIYLRPTDEREVRKTIQCLSNKFSYGPDEIPPALIKACVDELTPPLTALINQSFDLEQFPDKLKMAKIRPIPKKGGKKDNVTQYRPIALLPAISKIYEKIVTSRLNNFLEKFNILNDCQFGFRKKRSTTDAVYKYIQLVYEYIRDRVYGVGILLDMTKAYEKVSHTILLKRLFQLGVRGKAYKWFESYLSNRQQYVEIDYYNESTGILENIRSNILTVRGSIPQGSVVGCILFLTYINSFQRWWNHLLLCLQTMYLCF
ncbi:endonuclease-reverse transcriptase domain-containing protein [Phthorimaea operculella]|nr:endonuclease-reverse transcriptase domain-containing protein [Phthorimaea operculella]